MRLTIRCHRTFKDLGNLMPHNHIRQSVTPEQPLTLNRHHHRMASRIKQAVSPAPLTPPLFGLPATPLGNGRTPATHG